MKLYIDNMQLDNLGRVVIADQDFLKNINGAIFASINSLGIGCEENQTCACNTQCALNCLCPVQGCRPNPGCIDAICS
jgi:hypothetical protein